MKNLNPQTPQLVGSGIRLLSEAPSMKCSFRCQKGDKSRASQKEGRFGALWSQGIWF